MLYDLLRGHSSSNLRYKDASATPLYNETGCNLNEGGCNHSGVIAL